mmetsp:Transcript_9315/g.12213  ORF Transcript_9315/g.12213 Transcript_9315/m.12213 type:complete len:671 (-) Transcript_9315:53-2065(-)
MHEDPFRGLARKRRNYKNGRSDILSELEKSDTVFNSYDQHVAKDTNVEAQYSKTRLNNSHIYSTKSRSNNKKSSHSTNRSKKNSSNHQNKYQNTPSNNSNLPEVDSPKHKNPSVVLHGNTWTVNSPSIQIGGGGGGEGVGKGTQSLMASSSKQRKSPFTNVDGESTIAQSGRQNNQIETFDGGEGWMVSTFAEHSYVTTRIIPPRLIQSQSHQNQQSSQSNRNKLRTISDIKSQRYFQSKRNSSQSGGYGYVSPTDIKGDFVRKKRDELCLNRAISLKEKMDQREAIHHAMALEKAQLVSKVLLRGLCAVRAANSMKLILKIKSIRMNASRIITRTLKSYIDSKYMSQLRSLNSDSVVNKRKDVAIDIIKSVIRSNKFENKFTRGIIRVKNAARILQHHAKTWVITRLARHQSLIKLWRKLEPTVQREAQRLFNIKQARELCPRNSTTPPWLIKGTIELSELRTKCLKISNVGKNLIHENKRAEIHRKHLHEQKINAQNHLNALSQPHHHHHDNNSKNSMNPEGEEVQLNFLVKERTSDQVVYQECAKFLKRERTKIFEKHQFKQQTFRAKAMRSRQDDVADLSVLSHHKRSPETMYKYLLTSPYSVVTALKNAEESRILDTIIAEQRAQNDLLSVPMGKLYIFSGRPRQVFEALILHVCSMELEPFDSF